MSRPTPGTTLCRLDDLADPGAKGFVFGEGRARLALVVVRIGAKVVGYHNECPHAFTTLDFPEDRFLSREGDAILCGTHGARFALATGYCFLGPCKGRSLRPFPVDLLADQVVVAS